MYLVRTRSNAQTQRPVNKLDSANVMRDDNYIFVWLLPAML